MSKIEWTERTWNPVTGCTKVSPGCKNCYAERVARRFWGDRKFTDVQCHDDRLDQPLHWRKPSKIFVCSMSDLFHPLVPFEFIAEVFETMLGECSAEAAPNHTYQILTKRPERMIEFFKWCALNPDENQACAYLAEEGAPSYVWIGVSAETNRLAHERTQCLWDAPAKVRFVSFEPLLGPIKLFKEYKHYLDWVIVGGESGPGCRPMDPEWAKTLRFQCKAYKIPFFMKQLGGHPDKRSQLKDFPEDLRVREYPK